MVGGVVTVPKQGLKEGTLFVEINRNVTLDMWVDIALDMENTNSDHVMKPNI